MRKTAASKVHIIDTYCSYCAAGPGASCHTPSGKRVDYHAARIRRFQKVYRSKDSEMAELSDEDRELAKRLLEQLWGVDITKVIQVRLEDGSVMSVQPIHSDDYEWVTGHGTTRGHWRKRAR